MANWCVNWVTVEGKEANVNSLMEEVNALSVQAIREHRGVRPSEIGDLRYMFFIYINNDDSFSFESKWSPSNDSLQFLAKKYQVTIVNRYSELGCMVFGQWTGDGETEEDVWLTDEDWDLAVSGDEDGSYYTYEGKEYENEEEILDIILDNKINIVNDCY
jgi:hypothetical protein